MSWTDVAIVASFIIWTGVWALVGYHYGYYDGWENCRKGWRKKIDGLKEMIIKRKK